MSQTAQIREVIAGILLIPASDVNSGTSLKSLDTSMGAVRLGMALKRAGLRLPPGGVPPDVGALEAKLSGQTEIVPEQQVENHHGARKLERTAVRRRAVVLDQVAVGTDIEKVTALPETPDYWTDDFYQNVFTRHEIAYAVCQNSPRIHFAGFWCAKEALRKCDSSFISVPFGEIHVDHDADGKPGLVWNREGGPTRLPLSVSISHSEDMATAVVVSAGVAEPVAEFTATVTEVAPEPARAEVIAPPEPAHRVRYVLSIALLIVAALLSVWWLEQTR